MTEIRNNRWLMGVGATVATLFVVIIIYVSYGYVASPAAIRNPKIDNYSFRMQVIMGGQPVNFVDDTYQTGVEHDSRNELPKKPVYFYDDKKQLVHVRWAGMTGGLVLKNYGWNFVGGPSGALGYRFDDLAAIKKVSVHSKILQQTSPDVAFYVYSGDQTKYKERTFDEFIDQDLRQFFERNVSSLQSEGTASWLDVLFPVAHAHGPGGPDDGHDEDGHPEEELPISQPPKPESSSDVSDADRMKNHNLIGNVIIYVQHEPPTQAQIQDAFNNLEPLPRSN